MMRKLLIAVISIVFLSCDSSSDLDKRDLPTVQETLQKAKAHCGSSVSMTWLSDLVLKAEEDRLEKLHKGNYLGHISAITINGQKLFYTNFMMGSGGIAYYLFDCEGKNVVINDNESIYKEAVRAENIIYASDPVFLNIKP